MESFTIGELARRCSVDRKTIRYYEAIGVLPVPPRASNGYRLYADSDVARLGFVQSAKQLGLTLDEIHGLVPLADSRDCRSLSATLERVVNDRLEWIDRQIAALEALKKTLLGFRRDPRARVRRSGTANGPCVCADSKPQRKEVRTDGRRQERQSRDRDR